MARSLEGVDNTTIFSGDEMATIETVLGMSEGYVLDFSDRTFNDFVKKRWNIDATAPAYTMLGTSKANRLRGILIAFKDDARAEILQQFYDYRCHPQRNSQFDAISPALSEAYFRIIERLRRLDSAVDPSSWTGRPSLKKRTAEIRLMAPLVLSGLEELASKIEDQRFNDPETAEALAALRQLHAALGELIEAIDASRPIADILAKVEKHSVAFGSALKEGAKIFAVAPAVTFGVAHMLAWMCDASPDTGLIGTVYAAILGADALKSAATNLRHQERTQL